MAFIIEDGTDVTGANSWIDVSFADNYFADRAIVAWSGDDTTIKQPALIRAADYVHNRFGSRWIQVLEDQVDPELLYTFNGTIPKLLKYAQCEYALRALSIVLAPDPILDANGNAIVLTMKQLGPLEKKFELVGNPKSRPPLLRDYPAADMLLVTLIIPGGGRTYR